MKQISLKTSCKRLLADVFTPVGIYLRLRDRFRDTVLLESTDHHVSDNSYSFIGINAIAGMEIRDASMLEYKLPGEHPVKLPLDGKMNVPETIWSFMQRF
jgi:anthranilate synthase component 1